MAIRLTRPITMVVTLILVALTATPATAQREETQKVERGETATFGGQVLDLADDWGDARACMVWPDAVDTVECFASEAELDARVAELESLGGALGVMSATASGTEASFAGADCSNYLKLYDGTSYTGTILYLRGRYMWVNLINVGFNQKTSSYKVGACGAYFADYNYGGGAWYPTYLTQAYDWGASMISGWNNDVSSVYIY